MNRRTLMALGVVAVLVIVVVAAAATAFTGGSEYRAYDSGPLGMSDFRSDLQTEGYGVATVEGSPLVLKGGPNPSTTMVVMAGVERPFRPSEIDALDAFVANGGTLVVADDTGNGNLLSQRFGVAIIDEPVFEHENYIGNLNFSWVSVQVPQASGQVTNESPVVFDVAGYLSINKTATGQVLAYSTVNSWADIMHTYRRQTGDLVGPFPMVFEAAHGKGKAVFISNSAVFSNQLYSNSRTDNKRFAEDLVASLLSNSGTVVFEDSRHPDALPASPVESALSATVVAFREPEPSAFILGAVAIAAAALVVLPARETELGHHESTLDRASAANLFAPVVRVLNAARAKIRAIHGSDANVAAVTKDPKVAEALQTENGLMPEKDLRDLVERVRNLGNDAHGRSRGGTSAER